MHLTSIRLENIKSYVDASIELTPGTNAICGPNGSGKTTLVEAIGYALFGYLPYKQASFVREGELTGAVRIRLVALDGRTYEVVRHVGRSSQHYVFDCDLQQKVADKTTAVDEWVKQNILDGDGSDDPEFLFVNAIGVPQGLMTAVFLLSSAQRKPTFDRLLGIENYAKTSEKLRDTERFLLGRIAATREEIARLDAQTAHIGPLEETLASHTMLLDSHLECLASVASELTRTESELLVFDGLEKRAGELTTTITMGRREQSMRESELEAARDRRYRASLAADLVDTARPKHCAFVHAEAEFRDIEPRLVERDRLRILTQEASVCLDGRRFEVKTLSEQRDRALEAGKQAEALEASVVELNCLEARLAEAERAATRLGDLDASLEAAKREQSETRNEFDGLASVIIDLERRERQLPDLTALEALRQDLRDQYQLAVDSERQLEALLEEIRATQATVSAIDAKIQSRRGALEEIDGIRALVDRLPELARLQQKADADEQQVHIKIRLQELAREQLVMHQCPLLSMRCPAADDTARVNESLSKTMTLLQAEKAHVAEEHASTRVALMEAEKAKERNHDLTIAEKELVLLEQQLKEEQQRLSTELRRERDLRTVAEQAEQLKTHGLEIAAKIATAQKDALEIASVEGKREHADSLRRRMAALEARAAEIEAEKSPLVPLARSITELNSRVEQLLPIRAEHDRAVSIAGQLAMLEASSEQATKASDAAELALTEIQSKLDAFAELDATASRVRTIMQETRDGHDVFMRNEGEAGTLAARVAEEETAAGSLESVLETIADAEVEAKTVLAKYRRDEHVHLKKLRDELIGRYSSLGTEIQSAQEHTALARRQIDTLQVMLVHLETSRAERRRLERTAVDIEFFRQILKTAGPAITESLVQGISAAASEVFGDIMDDHALDLRWEKDYEIVVRRGTEDRPFVQLSGGEQMSAALAVRLALVKLLGNISVAFFDEPTQNMDSLRRSNLAEQIEKVRGFEQILIISHDGSFEHHTDSVIRLKKELDRTVVESA